MLEDEVPESMVATLPASSSHVLSVVVIEPSSVPPYSSDIGGGAARRGAASAAVEEDYPFDPEVMVEKTSWEVDRSRLRPSKAEAATSQADGASE